MQEEQLLVGSQSKPWLQEMFIRRLTEKKYTIGYNIPNWVCYTQLGIWCPQFVIISPIGDIVC